MGELHTGVTDLIPAGTQTYSKGPAQFPEGLGRALRGRGGHLVTDTHGEVVDWLMAMGSFPLGYCDPDVDAAIKEQLADGTEFSLPHVLEEEIARLLVGRFPGIEQVKFGKNGSDVAAAAVRAARVVTGRDVVISQGFHGWFDGLCPNPAGVPLVTEALVCRVKDWRALWSNARGTVTPGQVAAIIVEPDVCDDLPALRRLCDKEGIVLIFDEVVTGIRWRNGSVARDSGVTPDLFCLGKAIANGMPLSVVAGARTYMEPFAGPMGYSLTHGGECLSLAAARATLAKMDERAGARLRKTGADLMAGFNALAERFGIPVRAGGSAARVVIGWPEDRSWRTAVQEALLEQRVLLSVGFMPCVAHSAEDVALTLDALERCFADLAVHGPRPRGRLVGKPYRR